MAQATAYEYNVATKHSREYLIDFEPHVPTDEELEQEYQQRVKELIGEKYDLPTELGLTNDNLLAIIAGELPSQSWIDYRNYVEECKTAAHMEVFNAERT